MRPPFVCGVCINGSISGSIRGSSGAIHSSAIHSSVVRSSAPRAEAYTGKSCFEVAGGK
jgi:hypothetical protein